MKICPTCKQPYLPHKKRQFYCRDCARTYAREYYRRMLARPKVPAAPSEPCKVCKSELLLYGNRTQCKNCHKARVRRSGSSRYQRDGAYRQRSFLAHVRRSYVVTQKEYETKVLDQAGRCGLCGGTAELNVDHNHATGKVRGLLCSPCNKGLGAFYDNPTVLRAAADYLEAQDG